MGPPETLLRARSYPTDVPNGTIGRQWFSMLSWYVCHSERERERDSEKERKNIDFVQVSVSLHMHATLTVAAYLGRMRYLIFPHTNALQHRQGIQGTSNPEQWFNQRDAGLC